MSADKFSMKVKQDFLFLTFIMAVTTGLLMVSQSSRELFGDGVHLKRQAEKLEKELARANLKEQVVSQRYFDYGQSVAAVMGGKEKQIKDWQELSLLHVSRLPASEENANGSFTLLARGKSYFNDGRYSDAIQAFIDLEKQFPGAPGVLEAKFLRAESYYVVGQMDQCLDTIDGMMNFYPEHPMTGYLMLRLSQILQYRKRTPEALDVLKMVQQNFAHEDDLRKQAAALEKKYKTL